MITEQTEVLELARQIIPGFDSKKPHRQQAILAELANAKPDSFDPRNARGSRPDPLHVSLYKAVRGFAEGGMENIDSLQAILKAGVTEQKPIGTIMFWGASDKPRLGRSDLRLIDKFQEFHEAVRALHTPGLVTNIVVGDIHAIGNGYGDERTLTLNPAAQDYIGEAQVELQARDFQNLQMHLLSTLYAQVGMPYRNGIHPKTPQIFEKYRDFLVRNAERHGRSANEDPVAVAFDYTNTRVREQELLSQRFGDHQILTIPRVSTAGADMIAPNRTWGVLSFGIPTSWFVKDHV